MPGTNGERPADSADGRR